jgi:hypothetical protein
VLLLVEPRVAETQNGRVVDRAERRVERNLVPQNFCTFAAAHRTGGRAALVTRNDVAWERIGEFASFKIRALVTQDSRMRAKPK